MRAFARRVGVDERAVRKAIRNGRLERSLRRREGRLVIADVGLAEREWVANMDPAKVRDGRLDAAGSELVTTAAARRRVTEAQALRIEQEVARRAGELVPAREVETRWTTTVITVRTKMLGLPSRAKQALPHLSATDLAEIDRLVREALDELGGKA